MGQTDHGLGDILWCCKCEDTTQKYNAIVHSAHGEVPDFLWYGRRPNAWEFRVFGCKIEAKIGIDLKILQERTEPGYYMGTTSTKSVIRYWMPSKPAAIQYCTTARFFEHQTFLPNGQPSPGATLQSIQHPSDAHPPFTTINSTDHPFHDSPPQIIHLSFPPKGTAIGITIEECEYHNMPYIRSSAYKSLFQKAVPDNMKHNIWILAIENNNPITAAQAVQDLQDLQHSDKQSDPIKMVLAKRSSKATKTQIEQDWATFDQMRIVPHHIIDSDTLPHQSIQVISITTSHVPPSLPPSLYSTSPVH